MEDNSPDGTLQAAQEMKKIFGDSKILIISRPGKLGLGSAYIVILLCFVHELLSSLQRAHLIIDSIFISQYSGWT